MTSDQLLTIEQVSEWLQVPVATLRNWRKYPRRAGATPLPVIMAGGLLRYRRGDVEEWLEANTARQTRPYRLRRGA
jgi:predicted DNA-binding transcriptional regulator AlpA